MAQVDEFRGHPQGFGALNNNNFQLIRAPNLGHVFFCALHSLTFSVLYSFRLEFWTILVVALSTPITNMIITQLVIIGVYKKWKVYIFTDNQIITQLVIIGAYKNYDILHLWEEENKSPFIRVWRRGEQITIYKGVETCPTLVGEENKSPNHPL